MSKQKCKPRAQSKPVDRQQQATAPLVAQSGVTANADVIKGAGTKHGPGRNQWGPQDFAQAALHHIPNREKLSSRQRAAAVNKLLARDPGFCARFGKDKKIHRKTVDLALETLRKLGH